MKRNILIAFMAILVVAGIALAQTAIDPDTSTPTSIPTIAPESVTWAVLNAAAAGGTLTPGTFYTISDFRTYHKIFGTTDYNTGATEPLTVQAITATEIGPYAKSSTFSEDVIMYELNDSSTYTEADRGRIVYRKDNALNIEACEDWRNNKYERWESSVGAGDFNQLADPGGGEASAYLNMIQNTPTPSTSQAYNISIGCTNLGSQMSNVVIGTPTGSGRNRTISMADDVTNVQLNQGVNAVDIRQANANIWIGSGANHIYVGACVDNVTIAALRVNVWIGDNSSGIPIDADNVTIEATSSLAGENSIDSSGYYGVDRSTLSANINVPISTVLDMDGYAWAGVVDIVDIDEEGIVGSIVNAPTNHPVRIISATSGWSISNTAMVYPQDLHDANGVVLNGSNGDWLEFENVGGTLYYRAHQNYRSP